MNASIIGVIVGIAVLALGVYELPRSAGLLRLRAWLTVAAGLLIVVAALGF